MSLYTLISVKVAKKLSSGVILPKEFGTCFESNYGKLSGIKTVEDLDDFAQKVTDEGLGSDEDIAKLNKLYNWAESSEKVDLTVEVSIRIT